ncbi:MAG: hypothetical protein CMP98_04380 [Gammaproteobacteria bacterium]|nr:hypothetical protein [Gammaproteobacteria bacterium]
MLRLNSNTRHQTRTFSDRSGLPCTNCDEDENREIVSDNILVKRSGISSTVMPSNIPMLAMFDPIALPAASSSSP